MLIFKNRAYFSVTSIALNYLNVRWGNVLKLSHEKSVPVKKLKKGKLVQKLLICDSCMFLKMFVLENTSRLSTFVKMFLYNSEENIYSVY